MLVADVAAHEGRCDVVETAWDAMVVESRDVAGWIALRAFECSGESVWRERGAAVCRGICSPGLRGRLGEVSSGTPLDPPEEITLMTPCPSGTSERVRGDVRYCLDERGLPHGPMNHHDVSGWWHEGVPHGVWQDGEATQVWTDGLPDGRWENSIGWVHYEAGRKTEEWIFGDSRYTGPVHRVWEGDRFTETVGAETRTWEAGVPVGKWVVFAREPHGVERASYVVRWKDGKQHGRTKRTTATMTTYARFDEGEPAGWVVALWWNKRPAQLGRHDEDGERHGVWRTWDSGLHLAQVVTYEHGVKHGYARETDRVYGCIVREGHYIDGERKGLWWHYSADGTKLYDDELLIQEWPSERNINRCWERPTPVPAYLKAAE